MDADEQDILAYLKTWSGQYVSAREIARKAASKKRYEREPAWAVPALGRLLEKGHVEADARDHYRLIPEGKHRKNQRWISPALQAILDKTGKDFSTGVEIGEPASSESVGAENKPAEGN